MTTTASLGALTVALKLPAVVAVAVVATTAAATMLNDHAVAFAAAV